MQCTTIALLFILLEHAIIDTLVNVLSALRISVYADSCCRDDKLAMTVNTIGSLTPICAVGCRIITAI